MTEKNQELWDIMNRCNIYERAKLDDDFNHPIMMCGNDNHMRTQTYLLWKIFKMLKQLTKEVEGK